MSKRQQIVDKVKERLALVTTASGYQTDIGEKLTEWQLTAKDAGQLPGVDVRDGVEETVLPEGGKNSAVYERHLEFTVTAELAETTAGPANARKAEADIIKAVGVDPTWGGLARRTLPVTGEVVMDPEGQRIGGARVVFRVEYSRKPWEA